MALKVVWTKRADKKFDSIIDYLLNKWGELVTTNFVRKTHHLIELISEFPEMGSVEHRETGIRGFTIVKQVTVFYRIDGSTLFILNFFSNRQNPKSRKY